MITIKVQALTENAYNGLKSHYKESNTFKNKAILKAYGVTQELKVKEKALTISWSNLLTKIQKKIKTDFKTMLKEDQKQDFIKHVNNFMIKQKVEQNEYEVIFQ